MLYFQVMWRRSFLAPLKSLIKVVRFIERQTRRRCRGKMEDEEQNAQPSANKTSKYEKAWKTNKTNIYDLFNFRVYFYQRRRAGKEKKTLNFFIFFFCHHFFSPSASIIFISTSLTWGQYSPPSMECFCFSPA